MTEPVMAYQEYASNAELILACVRLGYLRKEWVTLDPTYGHGTFWKLWKPDRLHACDLDPAKDPLGESTDFTRLPFAAHSFDCVVFDPPYKLNGTPDDATDKRYGVHEVARWQDRMELIRHGVCECVRVLKDGYLLVKVQDQVCSGKVRWQTGMVGKLCDALELSLVDRLDYASYRPQPAGRRQVHARRNYSSLLVFKRGYSS